jgi:hypothetical protein
VRASTTRPARRRLAIAVAVPLALTTLVGCGSKDGTAAGPVPSQSSSSKPTAPKKPVQHDIAPAKLVALVRSGVADLTTVKVSMTTEVAGQFISAKGAMDLTGQDPAMAMSMDLSGMGTPTEMRFVDGVMYVQTAPGGLFVKVDLSDPNSPLGDMGSTMGDLDPRSMTSNLSPDLFTHVTDVGSVTVGGQRLEHYRVTADTGSALKTIKGMAGSGARLPKQVTYDLWLDGKHRMARFVLVMKRYLKVTAHYYAYGAPVHVAAPPPSQVTGSTFG